MVAKKSQSVLRIDSLPNRPTFRLSSMSDCFRSLHSYRKGASFSTLTIPIRRATPASRHFDSLLAHQLACYLAGCSIYLAVAEYAPFFNLAQRIAAFRDEFDWRNIVVSQPNRSFVGEDFLDWDFEEPGDLEGQR